MIFWTVPKRCWKSFTSSTNSCKDDIPKLRTLQLYLSPAYSLSRFSQDEIPLLIKGFWTREKKRRKRKEKKQA